MPYNTKRQNIYLYFIVFLEGFSVMTVELCSAQIIAPLFGNNLFAWTSILGTTLISLASGYYLGGKLKSDIYLLGWVLLIGSLCIGSITFTGHKIPLLLTRLPWNASFFMAVLLLLLPSLICLGTVPPLLIGLLKSENNGSGKIAGNVFTVSTTGNIFSSFLLAFVLLENAGVTRTLTFVSVVLSAASLFILWEKSKAPAMLLLCLILLLGFFNLASLKKPDTPYYKMLEFSEGILGQVAVIDLLRQEESPQTGYNRMLYSNHVGHTYVDMEQGVSLWSYINFTTSISSTLPPGSEVLILGMGGGNHASQLSRFLHDKVTIVEFDRRIPPIAEKWFGLPQDAAITIDDARHYIRTCKEKFDIIIFDLFHGEVASPHLLTQECFTETKALLNENGMMILNYYGFLSGKDGRVARSLYKTLLSCGLQPYLVPTFEHERYRNMLFVASRQKIDFSKAEIDLDFFGYPSTLAQMQFTLGNKDFEDGIILTDDKPIQEFWSIRAAQSWKQNYWQNYTQDMLYRGVPLFR